MEPVKFKAGDRVRYVGTDADMKDRVGTFKEDDGTTLAPYLVRFDNFHDGHGSDDAHWWCNKDDLVKEEPKAPALKVGDRIRLTAGSYHFYMQPGKTYRVREINQDGSGFYVEAPDTSYPKGAYAQRDSDHYRFELVPEERPFTVGQKVRITEAGSSCGLVGTIAEDDRSTYRPFRVDLDAQDDSDGYRWCHAADLEVVTETPKRPQVGQRVQVVADEDRDASSLIGRIGILEEDDGSYLPFYVRFAEDDAQWLYAGELAVYEPVFAVGDRVVNSGDAWVTAGTRGTVVAIIPNSGLGVEVRYDGKDWDLYSDPKLLTPAPEEPKALVASNASASGSADPLSSQVGGTHYTDMAIQPIEYILANNLPFSEGSVVKYVSRWRSKGGVADLKKARHFLDILISNEEKVFAA